MVDIYQEKSEKLKSGVKISQIFLNSKNSQQNSAELRELFLDLWAWNRANIGGREKVVI